jgi:hypothetical protein
LFFLTLLEITPPLPLIDNPPETEDADEFEDKLF